MSKATFKSKRGESGSQYRQCVTCPRFITSGDTHSLCVVCLGAKHAESAFEEAGCPHCERLPIHTLRSRRALFEEGVFASAPHGAGPASAEAERWLHSWGSQLDLAEGLETAKPLSLSSPARSTARSLGSEARTAVSSPQRAGPVFHLSPSEEEDVESTGFSPTLSPQYEELLEVVTRAVAKLNINWPADDQTEEQRSKLDERFLRSKSLPLRRSLPFFPDLHTEVSRSWKRPFSSRLFIPASDYYGNVAGLSECGYRAMPRVEQTLASYLAPGAASSLKAPVLPTKPLRGSSVLLGKGYAAAGQAGACLHTMAVLQAYQADLLKELDEGEQISSSDVGELRRTADLALRATKETARAIGRSMAAMVAAERHLWLTLSDNGQESQRRPVTHCQAVSKTVGSDGSSVQRDTFWPAVHETPTVVAQVQGVLPEGKPIPHDQVHAAMPTCLGHVEETLVLVSGPGPGSSLPPRNASDGCIPDRLGSGHEWPPCPRSVEWSPSHVAHQLPGDAGRVSSTETFSSGPKKSQCASTHRQHSCGFLCQPPGRSAFAPLMQAGAPDPCVVPGQVPLAESGLYSWASQYRSRHPVEAGAEAWGMEASPRGGEADLESFWPGTGGSVCDSSDIALSPLVLSDSSGSAGAGCYGTDVAEASSVRLPPDCSAPGSSRESAPGRGPAVASSPVLAGPSMVLGPDFSPRRLPMGDSSQERSPLRSGGHDLSPPPGVVEAVGVAPEGARLIASGLSTEVVETILQSRAPSTRKLYGLKWRLFTSWCGDHQLNPVNCPIGTVLEFLQARFSAGLSHSTLRVYVAAIASYHAPMGGQSVGKDPLIIRFLRGVLRLRPRVRSRVPPWDLAVVLEALCKPPFEPIEQVSERLLTLKTVLLLAISSLKRVGDLQALSVASIDFTPGLAKVFLYPRVGYVPKVPSSVPRPVVLQAFCPPPFREPNQEKLNCMCPVRALDAYVHRTALWRKSDQLLVCYGPPKKGFPAAKQTLSRWIVDAIIVAYESSDLPSPLGVKAHSTRGMAASKAFFAGVPIQDICDAAGWSTPLTFVRFYDLDLQATPGSAVLLP